MSTLKLRIQQKGLLVVALPFAFQLAFVAVLFWQLQVAKFEAEREAHATKIVGHLNDLRRLTEEACLALVLFKSHRDQKNLDDYDKTVNSAGTCISELLKITASDTGDNAEVEKISRVFKKTVKMLEESKENLIEGNEFASLSSMPRLFLAGYAVKQGVDKLGSKYHDADTDRMRSERRRAAGLEGTILGLVIADIFLAFFLANYMSRSVTGRLQTLMQNSRRLAAGEPLLPALDEEDEISDLDRDFRSMADALNRAQNSLYEMTQTALANEANVRSIIENMPLGVLIINETDEIELVNPRLEQMFGYTAHDLRGIKLEQLLPQPMVHHKEKRTNEVRKGLDVKSKETVAHKRSGEDFFVEIAITKFSDTKGKQFLIIIQDVSERHEMERMKREFVAMVSHDLRTPLTAVQGTLDLLNEGTYGELTSSGTKRVQVASDSIDRLIGLINDLLDIEKLEAGKMRMDLKPVDLDKILTHSLEAVRVYAEQAQIALQYEPVHLGVMADRDRLIQVVVNFLSNAVKFSEPGQKVVIEADKNGEFAEVRVIDSGRGIPESHLGNMFERFKQVKAADGARKKGTGLGLAISKAIIENHEGLIGVTSVEGKGSTFYFRIPLAH